MRRRHLPAALGVRKQLVGTASAVALLAAAFLAGREALAQPKTAPSGKDAHGDALPDGALLRMGTVRWRHGDNVTFVAFTKDGNVVTASQDGVVRLWDRDTGKEIRRFGKQAAPTTPTGIRPLVIVGAPPTGSPVGRVALSSDGKTLATVMLSGSIQLWEVDTGKPIHELRINLGVTTLLFTPDGKTLGARSIDRTLTLFDTASGKQINQFRPAATMGNVRVLLAGGGGGEANGVAFSHDGKQIAASEFEFANNNVKTFVRILDTQNGKEIRSIDTGGQGAAAVAFSPDGKMMAFVSANTIQVREAEGGKELNRIKLGGIAMLEFSPDSKILAAKGRNQVTRLYDARTGNLLHELGAQAAAVAPGRDFLAFTVPGTVSPEARDVAFSSDSKTIVTGNGQTLRFWNVSTGKEQTSASLGHRGAVTNVMAAADGQTTLSRGADGYIRRWDARTGNELGGFAEPRGTVTAALAPDGSTVAFSNADGTLRLHAAADGKELQKFKANQAIALAFAPDSKTLASRGNDGTIRLYEVANGQERKLIRMPGAMAAGGGAVVVDRFGFNPGRSALAFSPDGQTLAANFNPGGPGQPSEGTLRIWDVTTGKEIRQITMAGRSVQNLIYSPDGRLLAAENADQSISLWEIASARERRIIGQTNTPPRPATPELAVAVRRGFTPMGPVSTALTFSPDGTRLAARGPDNGVRIWDVVSAAEVGLFKGHQGAVLSVSFARDGKSVTSGSADTTLLVWDMSRISRAAQPQIVTLPPGELEGLWSDLSSADAMKAGLSIERLASAGKLALPFLSEHLKPEPAPDLKKIDQWIIDLNSSNFMKRATATAELEKLGDLAIPALKAVAATEVTIEMRRRVDGLLEKLTTGVLTGDQIRMVRSVESLERMATPEARQVLRTLADGAPGALQTRHAQQALNRFGRR